MNNKLLYIRLDTWNDMGDASKYLEELEDGKHDNEINYSEVWYDMAIVYCITTTELYIENHPELKEFIQEQDEYFEKHHIFRPYYPEYDPNNFGVKYCGEFEGWAPYKDFNRQVAEHFKKNNKHMNKTIDTATPKEIAEYLNHLHDTAWEKSGHKTDSDSDCGDAWKIWRDLYDFVFSDEISHKLTKRFGRLDYYDPDTSYYEDVTAYIEAFNEFADCYDDKNCTFVSFEEYQENK